MMNEDRKNESHFAVSADDIHRLAQDARIDLGEAEADRLAQDCEQLLLRLDAAWGAEGCEGNAMTKELPSADITEGALRVDRAEQGLERDALLRAAGRTKNGYIAVPRALEDTHEE